MRRRYKRQCTRVVLVLLLIVPLTIWGPYILSGVPIERYKWNKELMRQREAEKSRIDQWEQELKTEQQEWEQELIRQREAENSRIDQWEQELNMRKHQEKVRQEEWEQMQKEIRREEAQRQEQERLREEEWQREEEERQSMGLHWDLPIADSHCTAHNTREYWARLLNTVPFEYNWLRPCEDMPITIHGRSIKTTRCYINPDVSGEVFGHWLVDFNEPLCSPYWDQVNDKGCTADGSGRRRVEAHLESIHDGEDGDKLCGSAPFDIYGRHFDRPDSCANWDGTFGIWEFDDPNC